jgi:hypothetical protein
MTFAGMAMTRVGLNPRQRVDGPSFLAIFRSPSKVLVNVFACDSSTAQSINVEGTRDPVLVLVMTDMLGAEATQ